MKIILLVADSLKADAPGYAGGARSPFLDSLAEEGTWFKDAFASAAWTIPSLLSMVTGRHGHQLGIGRWRHPFPSGQQTLMTMFAFAGFEVSCFHPYPRWGFHNFPGCGEVGNAQNPEDVIRALKGRRGQDSFVLIHHWWTHLPYLNRELSLAQWHAACDFSLESLGKYPKKIARQLEETYLNSVTHLSEELLGRYLDAAGAGGEDVLFVLTGDHGETWGRSLPAGRSVENVYDLHGRWISDETIRVPLMFFGKGAGGNIPGGQTIGGFARGVDVGPTVAELAGIKWPGPIPSAEGPFFYDDDVAKSGAELAVDGVSLGDNIMTGRPTPFKEMLTVSSHNTHYPQDYEDDGPKMWRTMALRTAKNWFIWDGVDKTRETVPVDGKEMTNAKDEQAVYLKLETERLSALDSGVLVPKELFPERGESDEDATEVEQRLRTLGYLD